MNANEREILNKLFRDHGDIFGASKTTLISLRAMIISVSQLQNNKNTIHDQVMELSKAIKETEPRIVPLIHLLEEFEEEMKGVSKTPISKVKQEARRILLKQIEHFKENVRLVIEHGIQQIDEGDRILVHSASSVVKSILMRAKDVHRKRFSIIILEQDQRVTRELLRSMAKAGIDYRVVPEYSLCHHLEEADKLFLGAVSVTPDRKAITHVGTSSIVSLCHVHKVPVYLFINSLKFAHRPLKDQMIHRKTVTRCEHACEYSIETHSHDFLDIGLIDKIFTEKGLQAKVLRGRPRQNP